MTKQTIPNLSFSNPSFLGQFDKLIGFDKLVAFGKDNAEAWIKSGNAAVAGFKAVAETVSESSSRSIEFGNVAAKALLAVKSPAELQAVSTSLAKANFDAAVAESQRLHAVTTAAVTDSLAPLSARVEALSSLWTA